MRSLRMLSLVERVNRTICRHSLLPPGARVVVALSGGADSTALACLLVDLSVRGGFSVAGVVHFNHHLRGVDSDDDERFCRELAGRLGLAWLCGGADVRAVARALGTSLEDAARRARYEFLARAAIECQATHLAVGHTRDDQAETLLLQLLRGAGPRGLGAMAADRGLTPGGAVRLVRPLLEVGHGELVGWLGARGIPFREDESNRDSRFLRNRVRHELIPYLEGRFVTGVSRVLARDATIAASDARYLDELAAAAFRRLAALGDGAIDLDVAGLLAEPEPVARRVVLLALGNLAASRFVGFKEGERLLELAGGRVRGPIRIPGGVVELVSGRLVLRSSPGGGTRRRPSRMPAPPGMNNWRLALSIPGEVQVPGTGWTVSSSLRSWSGGGDAAARRAGARQGREGIVDASRAGELAVRLRRPGDAFRPLGLGGRKKLQDFFVDRKVPRPERDRVPLVVDPEDRIVWVAGHGIDDRFGVSADTSAVVILTLRGESA